MKLPHLRITKCSTYIFGLLYAMHTSGQNLIPNSGFESYSDCPQNISELQFAAPWYPPSTGTSDFYSNCGDPGCTNFSNVCVPVNFAGEEQPHSGNGYAGLYTYYLFNTNYREYIQCPLIEPMQAGTVYKVWMFVSFAELFDIATNGIGFAFTANPVESQNWEPLNASPVIYSQQAVTENNGWTKIEGTYTAAGNERFCTIGNFFDDDNTLLLNNMGGAEPGGYYYIDDVFVGVNTHPLMPNIFTPNGDGLNELFAPLSTGQYSATLEVFNRWGQLLYSSDDLYKGWDGAADGKPCSDGVYFWKITSGGEIFNGHVTLNR